jgi:hypothetical protein
MADNDVRGSIVLAHEHLELTSVALADVSIVSNMPPSRGSVLRLQLLELACTRKFGC